MKFSNFLGALINPKKFTIAILWRAKNIILKIKNREKKISLGLENSKLKFYIIGFNCDWNGLAWIIIHIIEHIGYSENKKYIPIIDLRNFHNQYSCIGEENIWGRWFEQPTEYDLYSIAKSKNIIKSRNMVCPNDKYLINFLDYKNETRLKNARDIYNKHIKINTVTQKKISQIQQEIIGNKKVLGIMCRGTDYSALKPPQHPIQPNPQNIIDEAEIIMKKYNCTHIFLSTEDRNVYNLFHEKFGTSLLSVNQERITQSDICAKKSLSDLSDIESRRNTAFSYLTSMYILSKCPCFIGGITGGSLLVKIMSNGFEYEHLHDCGTYPDNVKLKDAWKNLCDEL